MLDMATDSTPFQIGDKVTGNLPTGRETKIYRFQGTAGQRIAIDGQSLVFNQAGLRLITPTGVTLYNGDATQDSALLGLPETSTYYIIVSGVQSGSADIAFQVLDRSGHQHCSGFRCERHVSPGNAAAFYKFQGIAGQELYYDALAAGRGANVFIVGPNGTNLTTMNVADDQSGLTLPISGTYLISVAARSRPMWITRSGSSMSRMLH